MKKTITLLFISLFFSLTINSQDRKQGRNKIKALKLAYISGQLELTTREAQKFWPIYNGYQKEQYNLRATYRDVLKKAIQKSKSVNNLSEEVSKSIINLKVNHYKKEYEIQKNFIKNIEGIISYKKILKLQIAEREFGRKLMKKYKRERPNSRN